MQVRGIRHVSLFMLVEQSSSSRDIGAAQFA